MQYQTGMRRWFSCCWSKSTCYERQFWFGATDQCWKQLQVWEFKSVRTWIVFLELMTPTGCPSGCVEQWISAPINFHKTWDHGVIIEFVITTSKIKPQTYSSSLSTCWKRTAPLRQIHRKMPREYPFNSCSRQVSTSIKYKIYSRWMKPTSLTSDVVPNTNSSLTATIAQLGMRNELGPNRAVLLITNLPLFCVWSRAGYILAVSGDLCGIRVIFTSAII